MAEADLELTGAPILIDRFLEAAVEIDVDAVYDGSELFLGGVMEHVEEAGVHSGIRRVTRRPPSRTKPTRRSSGQRQSWPPRFEVRGLINFQLR